MKLKQGEGNDSLVLNAEQTYQQALSSIAQAHAARYSERLALFQALGGGWWNRSGLDQSIKYDAEGGVMHCGSQLLLKYSRALAAAERV